MARRTDSKAGHRKGDPLRFLLGHSLRATNRRRGPDHSCWKGGRVMASNGYVWVYRPDHPRSNHGYIGEHVDMAERALGRVLPDGCEVHHVNEIKLDNRPGNLVLCETRAYHGLLHKRARALAACGDASAHRCYLCRGYNDQHDIYITSQGKTRHRACERAARKAQRRSAA